MFLRVNTSHLKPLGHTLPRGILMTMSSPTALRRKVQRLTRLCLALWLGITLAPVMLARATWTWGPWPVDFWMAAQGCVLAYLLIVGFYAWQVNRWEREAESLSFDIPGDQDG